MANIILKQVAPWSQGLNVTAGQYVTSGGSLWQASENGTTGATPPTGFSLFNDGAVAWKPADIMSLLQYLYTGVPTP